MFMTQPLQLSSAVVCTTWYWLHRTIHTLGTYFLKCSDYRQGRVLTFCTGDVRRDAVQCRAVQRAYTLVPLFPAFLGRLWPRVLYMEYSDQHVSRPLPVA